jgi:NAD(P)-dependent dehydrogenase (short-subunit alcohol dehydrogenase family)
LLHKTMAAELAADGVQVHSVDPGDMDTAMHHAADPGAQGLASPATVARALLPLFMPLLDSRSHPFATGTRLRVAGGVLEGADLA